MGDKEQLELNDNFIDRKMAEAFGFEDQQLADELDQAIAAANGQLPKAPEGELQRIMDRLDRENVTPVKKHRSVRIRRLAKVLIAATILGALLVSGSMWVGAKKYYSYEVREKENVQRAMTFNNKNNLVEDSVLETYEEIAKELNIKVLQLSYLPENMVFSEATIAKKRSIMEFGDGTGSLFFLQGLNDKPSSLSYTSDLNECQEVYNSFLNERISIYQKELENGSVELSARIIHGNQYYFLEGVVDVQEFGEIVKGIKPYNDAD
ncbi:MAG: hypothetical protein HFG75_00010 [Hungatella sp.]|nr:hypothetical protein [Hungatella sp.]